MKQKAFTLTIACKDIVGIVAAVSGFLARNRCFIIESAQMGDPSTQQFFMRTVFEPQGAMDTVEAFSEQFSSIAEEFSMHWNVYDSRKKPRLLILVSKQGHCFNDLLHRYASGQLAVEIPAVVSNHKDMEEMTRWHGIPFHYLPVSPDNRASQEEEIFKLFQEHKIDLMVLARYMQVLSPAIVTRVYGKAINIHHSFLPGFKGAKPYHQAYDRGVKIIGATAHYVSNDLDEGPIIEQEVTRVNHSHTPDQLLAIGRDIESMVLSRAVKFHTEHRVLLNGNKTVVFG